MWHVTLAIYTPLRKLLGIVAFMIKRPRLPPTCCQANVGVEAELEAPAVNVIGKILDPGGELFGVGNKLPALAPVVGSPQVVNLNDDDVCELFFPVEERRRGKSTPLR